MRNKMKWIVVIIVAIIAIIFAGVYIGNDYKEKKAAEAAYDEVRNEVASLQELRNADYTEREGDAPVIPDVSTEGDNPIDFEKLQSYNNDLIAWVHVPNTNIDYPVARYEGDDVNYYLTHDMYKEPQFAGCIYMQKYNSGDFSDNNTVLYGHNMKNGSMFANLHLFEDKEFFDQNRYIYVYMPEHVYVYEIFAAYTTDDTNLILAHDFSDIEVYKNYIDSVLNVRSMDANISDSVEVTADKKMITLSTCVKNQSENRYVVQGVLVEDVKVEQ